ncbi:MAG: FKBP-type peptidyl-prolyl cis-trans isomerase [Candidatus Saccharimonadales bacterium]
MAASTSKAQRMTIWVIAIVMAVGTLGSFFVFMLPSSSTPVQTTEQKDYERQLAEFQKEQEACPAGPVEEKKISPAPTAPEIAAVADVPELRTEDVTVGEGEAVAAGDCVELLYHGVLAVDAKAFQGGDNYAEGVPYRSRTTGFVPGFAEGLVGIKVGGERKIYIPSDKAYAASPPEGGDIPANADLVFAVRVIGKYVKQ